MGGGLGAWHFFLCRREIKLSPPSRYSQVSIQSNPDLPGPDIPEPRFTGRINFPRYRKLTVFHPDISGTPIYRAKSFPPRIPVNRGPTISLLFDKVRFFEVVKSHNIVVHGSELLNFTREIKLSPPSRYSQVSIQSDPDLPGPDIPEPRFTGRINFPRYRKLTVFHPDISGTPIYRAKSFPPRIPVNRGPTTRRNKTGSNINNLATKLFRSQNLKKSLPNYPPSKMHWAEH
eukprot:sb/3469413/